MKSSCKFCFSQNQFVVFTARNKRGIEPELLIKAVHTFTARIPGLSVLLLNIAFLFQEQQQQSLLDSLIHRLVRKNKSPAAFFFSK